MANKYQLLLWETYAGGHMKSMYNTAEDVQRAVDKDEAGDTLFVFLWRELADDGDPMSTDVALGRLDSASRDISLVWAAINEVE